MARRTVKINPDDLGPALIDAINIFCRDVLLPRGYLSEEHWGDRGLLEAKYDVARRVVSMWEEMEIDDDA